MEQTTTRLCPISLLRGPLWANSIAMAIVHHSFSKDTQEGQRNADAKPIAGQSYLVGYTIARK